MPVLLFWKSNGGVVFDRGRIQSSCRSWGIVGANVCVTFHVFREETLDSGKIDLIFFSTFWLLIREERGMVAFVWPFFLVLLFNCG